MNPARIITEIIWWWRKGHPTLRKLPNWRRADDAELIAKSRGCTRDIHSDREGKRKAVLDDLRRASWLAR